MGVFIAINVQFTTGYRHPLGKNEGTFVDALLAVHV